MFWLRPCVKSKSKEVTKTHLLLLWLSMPDDTLPLKIQSTMTQNPSWMMQKESFKFLMFPQYKFCCSSKNPHPFNTKNRWQQSKLNQFNNPTAFIRPLVEKTVPTTCHWINSDILICSVLWLISLPIQWSVATKPYPKMTEQINSLINTACAPQLRGFRRYLCSGESGQRLQGASSSDWEAPTARFSVSASPRILRTRGLAPL